MTYADGYVRMVKPRILDLFCGAGGSARGLQQAGFCVLGIDIKPQPHYAGCRFVQADALTYPLEGYDAYWASPPCQGYSRLRHLPWLKDRKYPMLIEPIRERLQATGKPWIIENVEDAPLVGLTLCGLMFGLPLYRHRKFESNVFMFQPPHQKHPVVIGSGRMLNDRRKGSLNNSSAKGAWGQQGIITVAGGQFRKADAEKALGINWMTCDELAEAIPPAYSEFLGKQLMQYLESKSVR
jgi:DNA (cytosine-5)-methyltransferase 1